MAKVEVYGATWCGYTMRARQLLDGKGVQYEWIDVDEVSDARAHMQSRGGGHTVPQIFIDDRHVGGCDDIHALDGAGKLDPLLGIA